MKKILIVYATAGAGHKKASAAIKKAFDEMALKDTEVSLIDSLDYTNPLFKWSYLQAYLLMVNKLPLLWGILYYLTDNFYVNLIVGKLRRLNNFLNSKRLVEYARDSKPDVIISTHFFASEIFADMKAKGLLGSHIINVVTDYKLHSWWVSPHIDKYVVGNPDVKESLLKWGVSENRIKIIGIPAEPVFAKRLDKAQTRKEIGFDMDVFTVLVIGGGFGVGPIEEIAKIAAGIPEKIQLIVICGHNKELLNRIEGLKTGPSVKIKALGFVDNVYYYMASADILISKSGGITVAESLVKELPMIIISPIIGQETGNCEFLTGQGAAIKLDSLSGLKDALEGLMADRERLARMREAIKKIRAPDAAFQIANMAVGMAAGDKN